MRWVAWGIKLFLRPIWIDWQPKAYYLPVPMRKVRWVCLHAQACLRAIVCAIQAFGAIATPIRTCQTPCSQGMSQFSLPKLMTRCCRKMDMSVSIMVNGTHLSAKLIYTTIGQLLVLAWQVILYWDWDWRITIWTGGKLAWKSPLLQPKRVHYQVRLVA